MAKCGFARWIALLFRGIQIRKIELERKLHKTRAKKFLCLDKKTPRKIGALEINCVF